MGKNIVVFSDGTRQKGGVGSNTNVYKLFNMIEDRTQNQIAYYDPGLGTGSKKILGAAFGSGFSENILECYRFIFDNFEADDQIYLFGFSRGAATVRSLSYFIHLFGMLPKSRADLIDEAFSIYRTRNTTKREKLADAFIDKHHTMWCKIKFLGVWDTVAALGVPGKGFSNLLDMIIPHHFHSLALSESVEHARHALSIDDRRKTFHPEIWDYMEDQDRLKQVWFAGVHTDVGGGYKEDDLSNISLTWMINEALAKGLLLYPKSEALKRLKEAKPNADGHMHNEQSDFPGSLFRTAVRKWDPATHGKIHIHQSVLDRTINTANQQPPEYNPWVNELIDDEQAVIEPWDKDVKF